MSRNSAPLFTTLQQAKRTLYGLALIITGATIGLVAGFATDIAAPNGASFLGILMMFTGLGVVMSKR